jgi:hypothetical protein
MKPVVLIVLRPSRGTGTQGRSLERVSNCCRGQGGIEEIASITRGSVWGKGAFATLKRCGAKPRPGIGG